MKQTKKTFILSIVAIAILVVLIVGATFAYFQAQEGTASNANINVTTATTDMLTFSTGNDISIEANIGNFANNMVSLSASTSAKITLTANNSSNNAAYNYFVYLSISNNSFIYSQNNSMPELVLTVIGPDGNEVTSLGNLTYTEVTDNKGTNITGFDVTTFKGEIVLANNKEILAGTSSTVGKATNEEEWNVKLTFVNYDADQRANAGNSVDAVIVVEKGSAYTSLADVCANGTNLASCITTFSNQSVPLVSKLYYHNSGLTNGAGDNSYRYAGSASDSYCTYDGNVVLNFETNGARTSNDVSILKDNCSNVYKVVVGDDIGYFDKSLEKYFYNTSSVKWDSKNNKCVTESNIDVYDYGSNPITNQSMCTGSAYQYGDEDMYILGITEVGSGVISSISITPTDELKNYVCFGSNDESCPENNLYRIIGVFDNKVKLIKNTSLGSMAWDSNGLNTWSSSSINTYLNGTYLDSLTEAWSNKILTTTWKVGGISNFNILNAVPATVYQNEIVSSSSGTEYDAKVGLMYMSDYGFAAANAFKSNNDIWSTTMSSYSSYQSYNWLYIGSEEWTISYFASNNELLNNLVWGIDSLGDIQYYSSITTLDVRPVFYISLATYLSGDGSLNNPFRISFAE